MAEQLDSGGSAGGGFDSDGSDESNEPDDQDDEPRSPVGEGPTAGSPSAPAEDEADPSEDPTDEPTPSETIERARARVTREDDAPDAPDASARGIVDTVADTTRDVADEATDATEDAVEDVGTLDDEAAEAVDAVDESADIIGGDTDEAVGRARRSAVEGDVAGVGDALAGDADEAVDRAREQLEQGDVGGAGDELAGPVDEAAGQAVDDAGALAGRAGDTLADVGAAVSSGEAADVTRDLIVNQAEAAEAASEGDLDRAGDELVGGFDEFVGSARVDQETDPTTPSQPIGTTRGGGPSDLTEGGFLTEAQERELKETGATIASTTGSAVSNRVDAAFAPYDALDDALGNPTDVEASAEIPGTGVTVSVDTQQDGESVGERVVRSGTSAAAGVGNVPATVASLETTGEVASSLAGETAENPGRVTEQATAVGRNTAEEAAANPARTAGAVAGGAVTAAVGAGATAAGFRGLSRASRATRGSLVRARSDATVDLEDLASEESVETGEQPEFDTPTDAPTREAVAEFRSEAADQPDELRDALGTDAAIMRSETDRLPEDLEVGRGVYELPGLFGSPELAPLRLDLSDSGYSGGTEIRPPGLRDLRTIVGRTQRTSAFPGDRVEGIPDRADESGTAGNDEPPDPDLSGVRFLDGEADEGTAFVRPPGDRTPEFEAVFPPGTEFRRSGQLAVELPNDEVATLDVFRRPEDVEQSPGLRDLLADTRGSLGSRPRRSFDPDRISPGRHRAPDREQPGAPATPTPLAGTSSITSGFLGGSPGLGSLGSRDVSPSTSGLSGLVSGFGAGSGIGPGTGSGDGSGSGIGSVGVSGGGLASGGGGTSSAPTPSPSPSPSRSPSPSAPTFPSVTPSPSAPTSPSPDPGPSPLPSFAPASSPSSPPSAGPASAPTSGIPSGPATSSSRRKKNDDEPDDPDLPEFQAATDGSGGETADDQLAPGWLAQTLTTIATEGRDPDATAAPSQATLEDQPLDVRLSGELPTQAQVSGDEATQERIDDVVDLFTFGGDR